MRFAEHQLMPHQAVHDMGRGRVIVFAPHPDDETLGCGGAILRHVAAGDAVEVVIVTDGGHVESGQDRDAYVRRRREECLGAAVILGYGKPVFWDLHDRSLEYGEVLTQRVALHVEQGGADIVYGPSLDEIHPDHRALGMALLEAVRRSSRNLRLAAYEIGAPLVPNVLLDITDIAARKQQAIACYASQLRNQRYDEHIEALNRYRTYTLPPEVKAAEAFRVLSSDEARRSPIRLFRGEFPTLDGLSRDSSAPLVSVIVRTLGRATLTEALASIGAQTYGNIEVVVVDARGEGALELPPACGRHAVRCCATGERLGRSRAANTGLHESRGQYVIFLDDDDWFLPDHLSKLVGALQVNRFARLAYTGVECAHVMPNGEWTRAYVFDHPFDRNRLLCENFIPIHAALFERSLYEEGCRLDEELDLHEDWDLWLQILQKSTFVHVPAVSAVYRYPGGSAIFESSGAKAKDDARAIHAKWRDRWTADDLAALMKAASAGFAQFQAVAQPLPQ